MIRSLRVRGLLNHRNELTEAGYRAIGRGVVSSVERDKRGPPRTDRWLALAMVSSVTLVCGVLFGSLTAALAGAISMIVSMLIAVVTARREE